MLAALLSAWLGRAGAGAGRRWLARYLSRTLLSSGSDWSSPPGPVPLPRWGRCCWRWCRPSRRPRQGQRSRHGGGAVAVRQWPARVMWALVLLPYVVPPALTGIGLIGLWRPMGGWGLYGSAGLQVAAELAPLRGSRWWCWPPRCSNWIRRCSGRRRWWAPRRCAGLCPASCATDQPGLAVAAALSFVLSLGEIGASLLVAPAVPGDPVDENLQLPALRRLGSRWRSCCLMLLALAAAGAVMGQGWAAWWVGRRRTARPAIDAKGAAGERMKATRSPRWRRPPGAARWMPVGPTGGPMIELRDLCKALARCVADGLGEARRVRGAARASGGKAPCCDWWPAWKGRCRQRSAWAGGLWAATWRHIAAASASVQIPPRCGRT